MLSSVGWVNMAFAISTVWRTKQGFTAALGQAEEALLLSDKPVLARDKRCPVYSAQC
ncbi:hypothetical protein RNAN_1647 [Rheinheimera nanhaiensis E407-8]|uniref:Uncharacterized protein n=1 Tax=Rheinheimera nanhaiensis E407-8 TaxID=562729 RepID=I1DX89_9GAMM|nr:hypothetical protein RNAN_1647 [Rheinheimera nanhaiensis E407-8]